MSINTLILDTETTGVPKDNYKDWHECYAVQIAYIIINKDYKVLTSKNYYIKDLEHVSSKESLRVHHIDETMRNSKGILIKDFLELFRNDIKKNNVKFIVTHGTDFDIGLLIQECYRNDFNYDFLRDIKYFNTKLSSLYHRDKRLEGSVKRHHLQVDIIGNAHDAMYDVYLCLALFKNSVKRNMMLSFESIFNLLNL